MELSHFNYSNILLDSIVFFLYVITVMIMHLWGISVG